MHIEKKDDITIKMEIDYGRIRIKYEPIDVLTRKFKRLLICNQCNYENEKKVV